MKCGYREHADKVGAMNILERGHCLLACGEHGVAQLGEAGTPALSDKSCPISTIGIPRTLGGRGCQKYDPYSKKWSKS